MPEPQRRRFPPSENKSGVQALVRSFVSSMVDQCLDLANS